MQPLLAVDLIEGRSEYLLPTERKFTNAGKAKTRVNIAGKRPLRYYSHQDVSFCPAPCGLGIFLF
jgi:hypothetical protein